MCACVQWKKTLFVPFSLAYPLFLKVYSCYRLTGSNRVLAFFEQTVHLEKQSIDYTEEECLFTVSSLQGCVVCSCSEKCSSLYCYLFSVKLFFSKAKPAACSFDNLKYSNCWQDMTAEVIWLGACPDF